MYIPTYIHDRSQINSTPHTESLLFPLVGTGVEPGSRLYAAGDIGSLEPTWVKKEACRKELYHIIYIYVYTYTHTHTHTYIYIYTYIYLCMYLHRVNPR